ncbi:MAG: hypothetical protein JRE13_14145, partial [Deltaproteobacteria bacterium]|nr:hypothetical protein [Deltaproteobacteria bacterium]
SFFALQAGPDPTLALEEAAETVARVRPVFKEPAELARAEPPREELPEPERAPEAEPEARPRHEIATRVIAGDLRSGDALLGGGGFPVLSCSYSSFPSFRAYARAMSALGARFVVVQHREIVGGVDVETGLVRDASGLAAFSPRARDYTSEPGLSFLARAMRDRFGAAAVVMMLVPRSVDAGLFGRIARFLEERGEHHQDYREIRGRYERSGSGILLRVESGLRRDGREVAIDLLFDLADIADAGARA